MPLPRHNRVHVHPAHAPHAMRTFTKGFADFISASPVARHAALGVAALLEEHGFTAVEHDGAGQWPSQPGGYYLLRDGAIVAFTIPETVDAETSVRIVGAHTDSPALKLKDMPTVRNQGFCQVNAEIYGGPIIASWFDVDLKLAGSVITADGQEHVISSGPVGRVPHLAIHLDREKNESFSPHRQSHLQPILDVDGYDNVLDFVGYLAGIKRSDVIAHDLFMVPAQEPQLLGATPGMFASSRLDNLSSVYPAVVGLLHHAGVDIAEEFGVPTHDLGATEHNDIVIVACFDHEEIGSATRTGAQGPMLEEVLLRTARAVGFDEDQRRALIARSSCVSADAAHSIHPNYTEHHDVRNYPVLGRGTVVKMNANHRYATDAHTAAAYRQVAGAVGEPTQGFVSRNNMPCGTTIGPLTSTRIGIPTVDVGVPLLSMHSARELCHIEDVLSLTRVLAHYFSGDLLAD